MTCRVGKDVNEAARILRGGGLVAFATETVYGLGGRLFDERALARIFEVKGRPTFDPLIAHIGERKMVDELASEVPAVAERLIEGFWPGPLTVVLKKKPVVPDLATAGLGTVAVRMPDHAMALELLRECGFAVAAPSANLFGRVSPTTAEHVREQLGERIDYILDGGPCRVGVESTVLNLTEDVPVLLRHGGVIVEELEQEVGRIVIPGRGEQTNVSLAPGQLRAHYAPGTPMVIAEEEGGLLPEEWRERVEEIRKKKGRVRLGWIGLAAPEELEGYERVEELSAARDLREAAARFFAAVRRLDASGLDVIVASRFPDEGLGRALNDRLMRGAVGSGGV